MPARARLLESEGSLLLLVDLQTRLMPAIHGGDGVLREARRLLSAARLLGVPVLATEQNPQGLGATLGEFGLGPAEVVAKMTFDATASPAVAERIPGGATVLLAGCESHVCVLQTALGLLARGHAVAVAADAVGSRRAGSKAAALRRLDRHGVEIVTAEMAIFEWLGSAEHPRFRDALALVR